MVRMQITTAGLVRAFWRDRWLVVAVVVLAALLSVAYALTRKPEYTSEALLASAGDADSGMGALNGVLGQVSALGGVLGLPHLGGTSLEEAAATMRSREFTLRFIQEHGLLPVIFPDRTWTRQRLPAAQQDAATGSAAGAPWTTPSDDGRMLRVEDVLDRFDTVRTLSIDRRTNFLTLSVRARDPRLAQSIARELIEETNSELRERALVEARAAEQFLQSKVIGAQYESIKNTAAALLEGQLKKEVLAESRSEYALRVLDPPSLPETRSYPRRTKMVALGVLLGGLGAAAIVLVRRRRELQAAPGGGIA